MHIHEKNKSTIYANLSPVRGLTLRANNVYSYSEMRVKRIRRDMKPLTRTTTRVFNNGSKRTERIALSLIEAFNMESILRHVYEFKTLCTLASHFDKN